MPRALDLLAKAATAHAGERRIGHKPGEVRARTVVRGRSYDHVRTARRGVFEIHPTNLERALGHVRENGSGVHAGVGDKHLGAHADHHKAARAVVDFHGPRGGIDGEGEGESGFGVGSDSLREGGYE